MTILALDIATTLGWALLDPATPNRPLIGSVRLPADVQEIGRASEGLRQFLSDQHVLHGGFSHIIFEAQHVGGKIDANVVARLFGLAAMTEWFAFKVKAECYKVHISTWRKHAFGMGNINRNEAKVRAMDGCRAMGFEPKNDNEAEAFFILDYFLALRNREGAKIAMPWRDNSFFKPGASR